MGCCRNASVAIIFLFSVLSSSLLNAQERIINGDDALLRNWYFIVQLLDSQSGEQFCAGSVISPEWVITAAHCVANELPSDFMIGIGSHIRSDFAELRTVSEIHIHPEFNNPQALANDVALLRLTDPTTATPISLTGNIDDQIIQSNGEIASMVAGWGVTEEQVPSRFLQEARVNTISHVRCRNESAYPSLDQSMICATNNSSSGTIDACYGDSGGPLVVPNSLGAPSLIGIVSWGTDCARPEYPGVYTRLHSELEWIYRTTLLPSPRKLALQLDEEYDLEIVNGNDYFNAIHRNERWARASDRRWIYTLPDGKTYDWKGTSDTSNDEYLGTLGPDYHLHFSDLTVAQELNRANLAVVLDHTLDFEFSGDFYTNYHQLGYKWFKLANTGYGSWAYLTPDTGTLSVWHGSSNLAGDKIVAVLGDMFFQDALNLVINSYKPTVGPLPPGHEKEIARVLDEYYEFRISGSTFYNWLGLSESWFRGKHGWYYLVPIENGKTELRSWSGDRDHPEDDIPLARFSFVSDPQELAQAAW